MLEANKKDVLLKFFLQKHEPITSIKSLETKLNKAIIEIYLPEDNRLEDMMLHFYAYQIKKT